MSRLMAEMLDLESLKNSDLSLDLDDFDLGDTEEGMALFAERTAQSKKRRQLAAINAHLRGVHDRITHTLEEAGVPAELPEARLDNAPALSYRPPEFCIKQKETEEQKQAKKTCEALVDSSCLRTDLIKAVEEWMRATSTFLEGRTLLEMQHTMLKREHDSTQSFSKIVIAMRTARAAVAKLRLIGEQIFEDLDELPAEPSSLNEKALARVNARVRRDSALLDSMTKKERKLMLKYIMSKLGNLPGDMKSLKAGYDEEDEGEQELLSQLSSEWKTACNDIRDLLISIHELKILKRPVKLRIRRILYLFKIIVAILDLRDKSMEDSSSELVNAEKEIVNLKSRLEHVNSEVKVWREKFSKTQSIVVRISKERDESRDEVEKLREDLSSCIDRIAELEDLNKAKASERLRKASTTGPQKAVSATAIAELEAEINRQSYKSECIQEEYAQLSEERDSLIEKLKRLEEEGKEMNFTQDQRVQEVETKLEQMSNETEELRNININLEQQVQEKENDIKLLRVEVEAKECAVKKLMALAAEDSDGDSPPPARPSSRRQSHCRDEEEKRRASESYTDYQQRISISRLSKTSSSRLAPKSSTRLALEHGKSASRPAPKSSTRLIVPQVSPPSSRLQQKSSTRIVSSKPRSTEAFSIQPGETEKQMLDVQDSPQRSNAALNEYTRLRNGWDESERKCVALKIEIDDLVEELDRIETRHAKKLTAQARDFRMKTILEEEKSTKKINAVYVEAIKVEVSLNRYKNNFSGILEKALMSKLAKDVKKVYNYNAADSTSNPVGSLKTMNEWISAAFDNLENCQHSLFGHMRQVRERYNLKAQQAAGKETAHNLKALSVRLVEIAKLKRQLEAAKKDLEASKAGNQKLARKNAEILDEMKEVTDSKEKMKESWKRREKELLQAGDALRHGKLAETDAESAETTITDLKREVEMLKKQFKSVQHALTNETNARVRAENIARARSPGLILNTQIEKPCPPWGTESTTKEKKKEEASQSIARLKTLEKLLTLKPTLQLSHVTKELVDDVATRVVQFRSEVAKSLIDLLRKYIEYRRFLDMQFEVRRAILKHKDCSGDRRDMHPMQTNRIEALYWHLEMRKESIRRGKAIVKNRTNVSKTRKDLGGVFRKVVVVLTKASQFAKGIRAKKEGEVEELKRELSDHTVSSETSSKPPVAPSNSVLSFGPLQSATDTQAMAQHSSDSEASVATDRANKREDEPIPKELPHNEPAEKVSTEAIEETEEKIEVKGEKPVLEQPMKKPEKRNSVSSERRPSRNISNARAFSRTSALTEEFSESYRKNQALVRRVSEIQSTAIRGGEWNRKASLPPTKIPLPKRSSGSLSRSSQRLSDAAHVAPDVPRTLQLDVQDVLHKARKHLQDATRRYSLQERPSTSYADLEAYVRSRRSTFTGSILPGVLQGSKDSFQTMNMELGRHDTPKNTQKRKSRTPDPKKEDALRVQVVHPPSNRIGHESDQKYFVHTTFVGHESSEDKDIHPPASINRSQSDVTGECASSAKSVTTRKSASEVFSLPSIDNDNK